MAQTAVLVNWSTPIQHVRLIRYLSRAYTLVRGHRADASLEEVLRRYGEAAVIATSTGAERMLGDRGVAYRGAEDYLDEAAYQRIEQAAEHLAHHWCQGREGLFYHQGISLGDMAQAEALHMFYFLVEVLKGIEVARAICEEERPASIAVINNVHYGAVDSLMKRRAEDIWGQAAVAVAAGRGLAVDEHRFTSAPDFKGALESLYFRAMRYATAARAGTGRRGRWRGEGDTRRIVGIGRGRHLTYLVPVARELARDGGNEVVLVGVGSEWTLGEYRALRAEGVPLEVFEGYIDRDVRRKVRSAERGLKALWALLEQDTGFKGVFTYDGVPLWGLVAGRLEHLLCHRFVKLVEYIEVAGRIAGQGIDIMIATGEVGSFERTVLTVAQRHGVPTLDILHGAPATRCGMLPVTVDRLAVWGDIVEGWFVGNGVPRERLAVTGQPRFDELVGRNGGQDRQRLYRRLGLDPGKGLIVVTPPAGINFTSARTATERRLFAEEVLAALRRFPGYQVVVRPHSSDVDISLYCEALARLGVRGAVVTGGADLYDLLGGCDLLVSEPHTTVCLEAMMVGRPVITVNLSGAPDRIPYAGSGAAIGVYRARDIVPAVGEALFSEEARALMSQAQREFVYQYAYRQDGQASRRVAELATEMIERSEGRSQRSEVV